MKRAGGKMELPAPPREPERPRRTTRPGTRTLVDDLRQTWDGTPGGSTRPRQRRAAHRRTRRNARAQRNGRWRWSAGVKRVLSVRAPAREPPRRNTRPGTRTLVSTPGRLHRRQRRAAHRRTRRDAPLIGERAATRGRSAMECGDERDDAKRRYPFEVPARHIEPFALPEGIG
jgi:hypothetical protein